MAGAPKSTAIDAAFPMTINPAALATTHQIKNIQKEKLLSISPVVILGTAGASVFSEAAGSVTSGFLMKNEPIIKTTKIIMPRIMNVVSMPFAAISDVAILPRMSAPRPKPIIIIPEARPCLSGNHLFMEDMTPL